MTMSTRLNVIALMLTYSGLYREALGRNVVDSGMEI